MDEVEDTRVWVNDIINTTMNAIGRKGSVGFAKLNLSFNFPYRKDGSKAKSLDEVKDIMNAMIRHANQYGKRKGIAFESIAVLSDWHHGHWSDGYYTPAHNGADYHFHLIFFGFPASVMAKELIHWFCNVKKYGMHRQHAGSDGVSTCDYAIGIDLGWLRYLDSNYRDSSDGVAVIRYFGTMRGRWTHDRWEAVLPQDTWNPSNTIGDYGDTVR